MGLRLRTVAPLQGSVWLRQGLRTFLRQPLGFCMLFLGYLVLASLVGWIPFIGSALSLATVPVLSLAFMMATRDVLQGQPVRLAHLVAVRHQPPATRRATLLLCLGFGIAVTLIIEFGVWLGGAELVEALKPLGRSERDARVLMEVIGHPAVGRLANTIWALAALVSVPYWHALALVHWGGQTAGQALFSSTLALWRTKGAFLVFGLGWLGTVMLASLVVSLLVAVLGAALGSPPLAMALGATIFVALSAAFYVSLWFMFDDSFGAAADEPPLTPPA